MSMAPFMEGNIVMTLCINMGSIRSTQGVTAPLGSM